MKKLEKFMASKIENCGINALRGGWVCNTHWHEPSTGRNGRDTNNNGTTSIWETGQVHSGDSKPAWL